MGVVALQVKGAQVVTLNGRWVRKLSVPASEFTVPVVLEVREEG